MHEAILKDVRLKKMEKFWRKDEDAAFQIRSSWAQFGSFLRFWRLEKSISYALSIRPRIPTPPASTILTAL